MRRHPGLSADHSGGRDFWSDENLNARAVPASATDFALLPGENQTNALDNSLALQQIQMSGGQLPVLKLAEVEVDEGFRSSDLADDYLSAPPSYSTPNRAYSPAPAQDESALADRIANMVMQRIERSLGGN